MFLNKKLFKKNMLTILNYSKLKDKRFFCLLLFTETYFIVDVDINSEFF